MNKATEEFCFKFNKTFDVKKISSYVLNYNSEWKINTTRQEVFDAHKNTETYFIHEHSLLWKFGEVYSGKIVSNDKEIINLVWPIVEELMDIYDGVPGQVILVKLKPFSSIGMHKDYGDYLLYSRRNHIPIKTNMNNKFIVDKEEILMKEGECWEINNSKFHSVINNSNQDRVHLIIDIIPKHIVGEK